MTPPDEPPVDAEEASDELPPEFGPPRDETGAAVPVRAVLHRSDETAITVADVVAYSTGFALELKVLRRIGDVLRLFESPLHLRATGSEASEKLMKFEIQYADGRRASNLDPFGERPPDIRLTGGSGGGGPFAYHSHYWAWPLPPPGPLKFAVEWPIIGLALTEVEIDARPILDAAAESERPWQ